MTVLPGRLPSRIASPGRRGNRGPGQGGNRGPGKIPSSGTPVWTPQTAAWKPPVPEPLPPAPLLKPWELLLLGFFVAAQIWGRLAGRPKPVETSANLEFEGKINTSGNTSVTVYRGTYPTPSGSTSCSAMKSIDGSTVVWVTKSVGPGATFELKPSADKSSVCPGNPKRQELWVGNSLWTSFDAGTWGTPFWFPRIVAAGDSSGVAWQPTPSIPEGWEPDVVPDPQTAEPALAPPAPVPLPLRKVNPGTPDLLPDTSPDVVPIAPGPAAPPATQPLIPRRTVPLPIPGATPTKDGAIVPQAPAPIAVTPGDAHFPVPGGAPVLGNGPQPKPETIAQELGRLEQKLARLSDPGPGGPGDGSDRLQLLSDLIGRLIEFATSMTSGGGYSLSSPCELDENGDRIVTTVEYPGDTNSLGVLSNKIDALAGVLQVHKDLKQPNCKQPAAVGQPVTVNFVQVD